MKYILGIVLLLIAVTVYFIARPEPEFQAGKAESVGQQETMTAEPETPAVNTADVERRAAMGAEFEKLKKARQSLESRLNRLKAILWDAQLPKEEGGAINEQMKNGYVLLKNDKLLGAYSSLEEISGDLAQIEFINESLRTVEDKYRSQRMQH